MDFKQKFKDLLNLSKDGEDLDASIISCCSLEEFGLSESEMKLLSRDPENTIREMRVDPLADQEILETIEAAFVDEKCDGGSYQLRKLAMTLDLNVIRGERQKLSTQLSAVTRKLFSVILQKQAECAEELGNVLDLQDKLDTALGICSSGRLQLNRAKQHLTMTSLGLLAHHQRRKHLVEITQSLKAIRTLEQMGRRVQELLFEENYAAAIQLLVEGQRAAETYKHFSCVAQLSARLQDTLEMAEEQLDVGLAKSCQNFNATLYQKLCEAFALLGKQYVALDQLNLHVASRLHNSTFTLVKNFVELSKPNQSSQEPSRQLIDYNKIQFQELCAHVTPALFIPCLRDLCTCLWNVTLTYYQIHDWHQRKGSGTEDQQSGELLEQKLRNGRVRLWQDVQNKTRTFLLSSNLWHFSIDEFLHVLDIVDRLMDVGQQFCGSSSEILQESVRQQSISYFRSFHRSRLDELRMFLENEAWEYCPVQPNFTILQLAEFHFLDENGGKLVGGAKGNVTAEKEEFYSVEPMDSPFAKCGFDSQNEENIMVHARANNAESSDDDADNLDASSMGPFLANTTLSVLRLFGRYIHFMRLLKTIAFDVLICINQLFDFYLYSVYEFFGTNPSAPCDAVLTPKLRAVLARIGKMLILQPPQSAGLDSSMSSTDQSSFAVEDKVSCPQLSPVLQLDNRADLFGIQLRLVAAESVVFVARQMELLRPTLKALISPDKEPALEQFFAQTLAVAQDLRLPIYTSAVCRCLETEHIVGLMSRVQWDIKEVMSQHSHYIDVLLQALSEFNASVQRVCHGKMLPPEVYNILWDQILRLSYHTLLDGFSTARKCSNEGRTLMLLDLRHFQMKIETLTRLRPLPDAALVETYIKAFYLPETALDEFVQQHTEYAPRHLMSLLQCVGQANKKTRLSLTALMEELDLSRR